MQSMSFWEDVSNETALFAAIVAGLFVLCWHVRLLVLWLRRLFWPPKQPTPAPDANARALNLLAREMEPEKSKFVNRKS